MLQKEDLAAKIGADGDMQTARESYARDPPAKKEADEKSLTQKFCALEFSEETTDGPGLLDFRRS